VALSAAALLAAGAAPLQAQDVEFDPLIGVFSATSDVRLDIGTLAMPENTPANVMNDYTEVVIYKLNADGSPNLSDTGAASTGDTIGIFSNNMACRVDLGYFATKENVPSDHESWATQLYILGVDTPSRGDVRYGDLVGFYSSGGPGDEGGGNDKLYRLNMAPPATKNCNDVPDAAGACYTIPEGSGAGCVSASHASWATALTIQNVEN